MANGSYIITYEGNGGQNVPPPQTKTSGQALILTSDIPSKFIVLTYDPNGGTVTPSTRNIECVYLHWNTELDGSGTTYLPGDTYDKDEDMTLYAIWERTTLGELPTPTRLNCQFDAWTVTLNGVDSVSSSTVVSMNTTIYAKWKYEVTLNSNGGIISIISDTELNQVETVTLLKTHGVPLTIPNYQAYLVEESPDQPSGGGGGYTPPSSKQFKGWGLSSDTEVVSYKPGDNYLEDSPITLYAVYLINYYTVIFTDGYSGKTLKIYHDVPHGSSVEPPPDPVREGFTFSGWLGDYSHIIADTIIKAFWGFTPIWIMHNNTWMKYKPKED